jgi:hypothetical protein
MMSSFSGPVGRVDPGTQITKGQAPLPTSIGSGFKVLELYPNFVKRER